MTRPSQFVLHALMTSHVGAYSSKQFGFIRSVTTRIARFSSGMIPFGILSFKTDYYAIYRFLGDLFIHLCKQQSIIANSSDWQNSVLQTLDFTGGIAIILNYVELSQFKIHTEFVPRKAMQNN